MTKPADLRYQQLIDWANTQLGQNLTWQPASTDAGFRRYFRARAGQRSWIAVDAPPERENNPAFIRIAQLAAKAGLHVPEVIDRDLAQGFLLLSDLGTQTYLNVLDANDIASAEPLMAAAIEALVKWQQASQPDVLPDYSREVLAQELELFREWYVPKHLQYTPTAAEQQGLDTAFAFLLDAIEQQPKVFVHRDYMPRNLMISEPLPGVIDFQDALYGPVTYDIASLFKDAFISWPEAQITQWQRQYWQQAKAAGIPVAQDFVEFQTQTELMGAQRHIKVLGIFARIAHRDGKPKYLQDAPRFVQYLQPVAKKYPQLQGLRPLLAKEPLQPVAAAQ